MNERKQRNRPGDHVDMIDALIDIERAAANPPPLWVLDYPRMALAHHRLGLLAALRASYEMERGSMTSRPDTLGSMTDHERGVLYERMGSPRNVDPDA